LIVFGASALAQTAGDYQVRCHIFKGRGQLKEAIAACSEAINAWRDGAPNAPRIFYEDRGEVYLLDGQLDLAIADFNKALSVDKRSPSAALGRGKALLAKGDFAAALEDFNRAYEQCDVEWPETLSKRGLAYEALGRHRLAIADFQRALRLKPDLAEARDALSRLGAAPLPWWHFW
jgi:tetratricopeptide (TPR) repeat protein